MKMSNSVPKYSKYCLVPHCISSSIKTPGKVFISLPVGSNVNQKKKRTLWLQAIGRNKEDISENTRGFVCEDHFNLEEDMENYMRFKTIGGNISLKNHVVPHIFNCQTNGKQALNLAEAPNSVKKERKYLSELGNEIVSTARNSKMIPTKKSTSGVTYNKSQIQSSTLSVFTQTDSENLSFNTERTVSIQHKPKFRSKFVQTDLCIPKSVSMVCTHEGPCNIFR